MKKNFLLLLTVFGLSAFAMSACSDDDDDNSDDNNNSQTTENTNTGGEQIDDNKIISNHHYVDLGLSVKWAQCNIGAVTPEGFGNFYAWGETSPKKSYDWDTYKWCNGDDTSLTKYNSSSEDGVVDNLEDLEPEDDAATVNWGSDWRTPTLEECEELIEKTDNKWVENYKSTKVNGYIFVSKDDNFKSDTLFLPAAGNYTQNYYGDKNEWGRYMNSNTPGTWFQALSFWDRSVYMCYMDRSEGFSVRPVTDK